MNRILFVDDDSLLCKSTEKAMARRPVTLQTAHSLEEARTALEKTSDYAVAMVDYRLGGQNGLHLFDYISSRHPDCIVVLMGGDLSADIITDAVNHHGARYILKKPWSRDGLFDILDRSLAAYHQAKAQRRSVEAVGFYDDS